MCSSNDLLIAYLSIELTSFALYILASFQKNSSYSVESGIKYFIVGSISSAFFLLGSSFIYGITGTLNFIEFFELTKKSLFDLYPFELFWTELFWIILSFDELNYWKFFFFSKYLDYTIEYLNFNFTWFLNSSLLYNFNFIEFGLSLILLSLYIKLALAPFHIWILDVYEGSPTSATFFFAVITKLSIFVILIRFFYQSFFNFKNCWQFYSLFIGIFSIFIASFAGLKQRKLKTLLAYSSINHMGYALIALSTNSLFSIQIFLLYIIIYMLSGLIFWYVLLLLQLKKKSIVKNNKELNDLILLKKSNPALAILFSLILFSIAGIPPCIFYIYFKWYNNLYKLFNF